MEELQNNNIIISDYSTEMKERYLEYAMSVIAGRALPDVRDGLKPIHRRILHAMNELGLYPDKGYKKCARIVGDVIGKYSPHGDIATYDALVRMAQDFSLRYPLIDGHGNFGSIDGDSAAAYRYCVTGDTLINTNEGLLKIKDIAKKTIDKENEKIDIIIQSHNNTENKAVKFFNSGKHPIIQIITTFGYQIKGSFNHPLLTLSQDETLKPIYKWKTLEQINEGDFILINRKENQIQSEYDYIDEKVAMFLGGMVSEGYISNENQKYHRIGFSNKNIDYIEDMKDAFIAVFPDNYIGENINKKTNCYDIYVHDKEKYFEFIHKYNFVFGSKNKEIPEVVLKSSLKIQSIFLRYLFEGDGCPCARSTKTNPFIAYSSSSLTLLRQVQTMLLQFGIISAIMKDKINTYKLHISGKENLKRFQKYINFAYGKKKGLLDKYIKSIKEIHNNSSKDYVPFISNYIRNKYNNVWLNKNNFDRLGSFNKNNSKLKNILTNIDYNFLNESIHSDYIYLKVNTKTYLEPETVYSIKVDSDCHSFTANGFINHNTEAKLKSLALEMIRDIDKNTVEFKPNFDGEEVEPIVMPSKFPNLLANGSDGIAVGMATSIPSHNLNELINGFIYLIDNPNSSIEDINKHILCPDFPTGGIIINPNKIKEIYETGRGSITIRSKYHIEDNIDEKTKKPIKSIVFTEIPYKTNKAKICANIAELIESKDKILGELLDIRDESDKDGIRIVIDLKSTTDTNIILSRLFQKTLLQKNFKCIFCVIVNNEPKILNLKQLMEYYIDFQKEIIINRSNFELNKAQKRLHILEGHRIAILNMDKTIELIRSSKSKNEAKNKLISELSLDEEQSQAILDLRLHRLTGLELQSIQDEYDCLIKIIDNLKLILTDNNKLLEVLKLELLEIKSKFGDKRRTQLLYEKDTIKEITKEDLIKEFAVTMVLTEQQYLKKTLKYSETQKLKEDDKVLQLLQTNNTKDLLLFTDKGRVFTRRIYELTGTVECTAGGGFGEFIPNILKDNLDKDEKIIYIASPETYDKGYMLYIFENNNIVKMSMKPYENKQNRQVAQDAYNTESPLKYIKYIEKDIDILTLSSEGKMLIQNTEGINPRTSNGGKKSQGNSFVKLDENITIAGVTFEPKENDIIKFKTEKKDCVEINLSDICQSSKDKISYYNHCKGKKNNSGSFVYNCRQKNDKIIELIK